MHIKRTKNESKRKKQATSLYRPLLGNASLSYSFFSSPHQQQVVERNKSLQADILVVFKALQQYSYKMGCGSCKSPPPTPRTEETSKPVVRLPDPIPPPSPLSISPKADCPRI